MWVSTAVAFLILILIVFQSPRAQVDRKLYKKHMQAALHNHPNLDIYAGSVFDLVLNQPSLSTEFPRAEVRGVKLGMRLPLLWIRVANTTS